MFRSIHNAFEPIYIPDGSNEGDTGLPDGLRIEDDMVCFEDKASCFEERIAPVREDGPEAWGYSIPVPAGGAHMWNNSGVWHRNSGESTKYVSVSIGGNTITVVFVKDGKPYGRRYVSEAE